MITYLESEHIIAIHDEALKRHRGLAGFRDEGLLYSCVQYPKLTVYGIERFPTVFSKAAAYLYYLAKFHVFNDGNKRTAAGTAIIFMKLNDEPVPFSASDMEQFVCGVAEGSIPQKEISLFLQSGQFISGLR